MEARMSTEQGQTVSAYDLAAKALAECREWMESPEFDDMINRMPREMAIQYLTRIATNRNLEMNAVLIRLRSAREFHRARIDQFLAEAIEGDSA
jgi:hypothetical protein